MASDGQTGGWWRLEKCGPEESEGTRPRNLEQASFDPGGRLRLSMDGAISTPLVMESRVKKYIHNLRGADATCERRTSVVFA